MAGGKVRATATFTTWDEDEDGRPVEVTVCDGDELPSDHAIVEGHREFFTPVAARAPKKRKG